MKWRKVMVRDLAGLRKAERLAAKGWRVIAAFTDSVLMEKP